MNPGKESCSEKRRQVSDADADDGGPDGAVALVARADADVDVAAVVNRLVASRITVL